MDFKQLNQTLQQQIGVTMTEEEQQAFVDVVAQSGLGSQKSITDKLIDKLEEKKLSKMQQEEVIKQAMAMANLYLISILVKYLTNEEIDKINESSQKIDPIDAASLTSALLSKRMGKDIEEVADGVWQEVVDAYVHDIDMFIAEATKVS